MMETSSLGVPGSRCTLFKGASPNYLSERPLQHVGAPGPEVGEPANPHPLLTAPPPFLPDSQRSHLSSFTMKLMDKFHSPKIKRTPSKKGKPPEVSVKIPEKPANKVRLGFWVCSGRLERVSTLSEVQLGTQSSAVTASGGGESWDLSASWVSQHQALQVLGFSPGVHPLGSQQDLPQSPSSAHSQGCHMPSEAIIGLSGLDAESHRFRETKPVPLTPHSPLQPQRLFPAL